MGKPVLGQVNPLLDQITRLRDARGIVIAGPTAVGKSDLALELAEKLGGEIISVDSMQVYRGLDIGTAKPTSAERARVPHHLIDICDLGEGFDAAQFVARAREAEAEIVGKQRIPIFCGGTGLYFKALLHGLDPVAGSSPEVREALERESLGELLQRLERLDPQTFAAIDRENRRRVVRALEIITVTGTPASEQRSAWMSPKASPYIAFGISRPRPGLVKRIDARVERMFRDGLVAETETLLREGLEGNATAMQAIGYRQVVDYLRGAADLQQTIELVKQKTRQYAKRQVTWFRRQLAMEWIELP